MHWAAQKKILNHVVTLLLNTFKPEDSGLLECVLCWDFLSQKVGFL